MVGHPLKNTLSNRLSCLGFNLFCMLVVDFMHEFELGIWKALFIHLIRILNAAEVGDVVVNELDRLTEWFQLSAAIPLESSPPILQR